MKKIALLIAVLAFATVFALSLLYRKAPSLLTSALERSLHKKVVIESIEYHFPGEFLLSGFKILENKPFAGEESFSAEEIRLEVSLVDLIEKRLEIKKVEVENANVAVRKLHGKMAYVLSDATGTSSAGPGVSAKEAPSAAPASIPLVIRQILLKKSNFKYMDYDVDENGFVMSFADINADVRNISLPPNSEKTFFDIQAKLLQGRDQKISALAFKGWADLSTTDLESTFSAADVYLPYFKPYYLKVTPANIQEGSMSTQSSLTIQQKNLNLDMDIEIIGLAFESYESDNQLFGFNADEIVSFLKDRSGKLKFQIVSSWDISDKSVRPREVIRKSIEKSLKRTLVSNVGVLVGNVIEKIGEKSLGQGKDKVEGTVQKIKDFLKY